MFTEHNKNDGANESNTSFTKNSSNSKLVQKRTDASSKKPKCEESIKDKLDIDSKRMVARIEEPSVEPRSEVNVKKMPRESNFKENVEKSRIEGSNSCCRVLQTDKNCNKENSDDAKKHKIPVYGEENAKCKKTEVSIHGCANASSFRNLSSFRIPKRSDSFSAQPGIKVEKTKNLESKQIPRFVEDISYSGEVPVNRSRLKADVRTSMNEYKKRSGHSEQRMQTSNGKFSTPRRSPSEGEFLKLFLFIL